VRAEAACRLALALNHDDGDALLRLAHVYHKTFRYPDAVQVLTHLLGVDRGNTRAMDLLAQCYSRLGMTDKALEAAEAALRVDPNSAFVITRQASVHRDAGNMHECEALARRALALDPMAGDAYLELGGVLVDFSRIEEAVRAFEMATDLAPMRAKGYSQLAQLKYYTDARHPHILHLERLIGRTDVPYDVITVSHFALGEIYDHLEQWAKAFSHYRTGNKRVKGRWSRRQNTARYVNENREAFSKGLPSVASTMPLDRLATPVFIVGMPRSGTTLVEQILASHPLVAAGGERGDIYYLANYAIPERMGGRTPYPMCLAGMDARTLRALSDEYLTSITALCKERTYFTDKNVCNFWFVGLIAAIAPHARFLHCVRDPRDTCLSGYFQYFDDRDLVVVFSDMHNIVEYYRNYIDMITFWKERRSIAIRDVRYEELIANPGEVIRGILDFCGLPWDERCLEPHKTARVVKTASSSQVKRPIYRSSLGRWRNYRDHIGPLLDYFGEGDSWDRSGRRVVRSLRRLARWR
jgi:tetratricopeptide (TPR) repeat protein